MRFLIIDTDYPDFLNWFYDQHPGLKKAPYAMQEQARIDTLFGQVDFSSSNLNKLGHEATSIYANNEPMQKAWAREHGLKLASDWQLRWRRGIVPWISRVRNERWPYDVLTAQIRYYKPDVVVNLAMNGISSRFLQEMKPYFRLLVGKINCTMPRGEDWSVYDLVLSSVPQLVESFRSLGVPSEMNRLAFEPVLLTRLDRKGPEIPVSFVGSFYAEHAERISFLEHLCSYPQIQVWGSGLNRLRHDSPIRSRYVGTAWGIEMYQILHKSKMTLNYHGALQRLHTGELDVVVVGPYANNLRLYEATGVGTLLVTDWKGNLHELFEPGKEVVAYRTPEECAEMVQYYLEHETERQAISLAGQRRTLRDHTYRQRMQELVALVEKTPKR
jgi:hypothetical protein